VGVQHFEIARGHEIEGVMLAVHAVYFFDGVVWNPGFGESVWFCCCGLFFGSGVEFELVAIWRCRPL
jgi:hypothetical protein